MSPSYPTPQSKATNSCMDKLHYIMLLAPFQPATRIELETNVNTSAECYLDIKNTGEKTLNVRAYMFLYLLEKSKTFCMTNNFAKKFSSIQTLISIFLFLCFNNFISGDYNKNASCRTSDCPKFI